MVNLKINQYDITVKFIRKKYGLYRYDMDVFENGKLVAQAVDYTSVYEDIESAVWQFLEEFNEEAK